MKILVVIVATALSSTIFAASLPLLQPDSVVAKYGKPDRVKSTEADRPRPPIVTRMLEYHKERVRFTFVPDGPFGSPPPYKEWRLMGFQDPATNAVIKADEVERRMKGRERAKP